MAEMPVMMSRRLNGSVEAAMPSSPIHGDNGNWLNQHSWTVIGLCAVAVVAVFAVIVGVACWCWLRLRHSCQMPSRVRDWAPACIPERSENAALAQKGNGHDKLFANQLPAENSFNNRVRSRIFGMPMDLSDMPCDDISIFTPPETPGAASLRSRPAEQHDIIEALGELLEHCSPALGIRCIGNVGNAYGNLFCADEQNPCCDCMPRAVQLPWHRDSPPTKPIPASELEEIAWDTAADEAARAALTPLQVSMTRAPWLLARPLRHEQHESSVDAVHSETLNIDLPRLP